MGAMRFEVSEPVKSGSSDDLESAFQDLRSRFDALSEGAAGYSGTIAEKNNYELRRAEVFASAEDARQFVEEDTYANPKWGPAYVVLYRSDDGLCAVFYGRASY